MFKAFSTVGGWTMISRVMGFAREIMLAAVFGAGVVAEAFYTAFLLPNLFRRFLAEGAFNAAFIPMFAKRRNAGKGDRFAQDAFAGLGFACLVLIVIVQAFMPAFIALLAGGFIGDERYPLTIAFSRISIFYILFMALAALCAGILNTLGKFALAAAAPVALNICLIGALILAEFHGGITGMALIWAVFLAGVMQLGLVWWGVEKLGIKLRPRLPRWNDDMKMLVTIALPATFSAGVAQINMVVGRRIASEFEGAIAWLNYADRLYQLPLGVIGAAIGVVLLPTLARQLDAGNAQAGQNSFNRAIIFAILFTLPATIGLMVFALPITSVLYERGAFLATDSAATAQALMIYSFALPAYIVQKCVLAIFYAHGDTKTPFRISLWSLVINIGVAMAMIPFAGFLAPAIGATSSAIIMAAQLWLGARRFGDAAKLQKPTLRIIGLCFGAGLAMIAPLAIIDFAFGDLFALPYWRWIVLTASIGLAMAVYFGALIVSGILSRATLRAMVERT